MCLLQRPLGFLASAAIAVGLLTKPSIAEIRNYRHPECFLTGQFKDQTRSLLFVPMESTGSSVSWVAYDALQKSGYLSDHILTFTEPPKERSGELSTQAATTETTTTTTTTPVTRMWCIGGHDDPCRYTILEPPGHLPYDGQESCLSDHSSIFGITPDGSGAYYMVGELMRIEPPVYSTCPPISAIPLTEEQNKYPWIPQSPPQSVMDCLKDARTNFPPDHYQELKTVVYDNTSPDSCIEIRNEEETEWAAVVSSFGCTFQCFPLNGHPTVFVSQEGNAPVAHFVGTSSTMDECHIAVVSAYPTAVGTYYANNNCFAVPYAEGFLASLEELGKFCFNPKIDPSTLNSTTTTTTTTTVSTFREDTVAAVSAGFPLTGANTIPAAAFVGLAVILFA